MLSKEWSNYDPKEGYEKEFQDVVLKDGRRLYYCWPNAGYWTILNQLLNIGTYDEEISTSETSQVRISHYSYDSKTLKEQ